MKLTDAWAHYAEYTKGLSANCRKLAFAAAAVVWILREDGNVASPALLWALLFIAAFFLCDILQDFTAAIFRRIWLRRTEKTHYRKCQSLPETVEQPAWLDGIPFAIWVLKIMVILIAWGAIGWHVLTRI